MVITVLIQAQSSNFSFSRTVDGLQSLELVDNSAKQLNQGFL